MTASSPLPGPPVCTQRQASRGHSPFGASRATDSKNGVADPTVTVSMSYDWVGHPPGSIGDEWRWIRQTQKLAQKLVLTQQLQQAIELLVLNSQELVEAVNKELLEILRLRKCRAAALEQFSEAENALQEQAAKPGQDTAEQNNGSQEEAGIDWNRVLEERRKGDGGSASSGGSRHEDLPPIEATLATSTDLADHLMWQLNLQSCTDAEFVAAEAIIHNLDHRGYLDGSPEDIMENGVHMDAVEGALMIVQSFDPIGVASKDLVERLTVQARFHWRRSYILELLEGHLSNLERRDYATIAKALGIHEEDVVEYHRMIKTLEPWPGRLQHAPDRYIIPDITVEKVGRVANCPE